MGVQLNIATFLAGLKEAERQRAIPAAVRAMSQAAQGVIGAAQRGTPVDTGALRASGTAQPAKMIGSRIEAELGFNTSYAAAVHERWGQGPASKNRNNRARQKFLELAIREALPKVPQFVVDEMRKVL